MLRSPVLIAALLLTGPCAMAENARPITPEEEKLLLTRGAFTEVTTVEAIPKPVLAAFARVVGDSRIANPGAPFNDGGSFDARLPSYGLVFAASSTSLYLIHYEGGGEWAHGAYYVACFRLNPRERPSLVWRAFSRAGRLRGIASLQDAIRSKSLVVWSRPPQ